MIRLVAGLKKTLRFVAGLIQSAENVKVTRIQCLPSSSLQSCWGHRHGNSELKYIKVNALKAGCVLCASKSSKKGVTPLPGVSATFSSLCRVMKDLDESKGSPRS